MLTENKELVEFYQGIIKMRKAIPQLRLRTAKEVVEGIHFVDVKDKNVVAYTIETEGQKVFVSIMQIKTVCLSHCLMKRNIRYI